MTERALDLWVKRISLAMVLLAPVASGATIVWGTATNVTSDTDVSTLGTLVEAANNGLYGSGFANDAVVNGVTFKGWGPAGGSPAGSIDGHFAYTAQAGHFLQSAGVFDSGSPPVSNLSTGYRTLLAGGSFSQSQTNANDFTGTLTLTISGLTADKQYLLQWWTNDSRPFSTGPVTAAAGNSVSLDPNTTNAAGGTGQFAIGLFTADATTQTVTFSTTGNADLQNAFQLREIPEPGSAALAGSMLVISLGVRRRVRD